MAVNDKPKIAEQYVVEIDGKKFCRYHGLVDLATQKNLSRVEVEILQYPTNDNNMTAICKATVESKEGDLFVDIGDANPTNVSHRVVKHLLRMASTRAKARALRDFTNIGMTAVEELADETDVLGDDKTATAPTTTPTKPRGRKPKEDTTQADPDNGDGSGEKSTKKISEAQRQAILNLSKRRGLTSLELERVIKDTYGSQLSDLSQSQASRLIQSFQTQKTA